MECSSTNHHQLYRSLLSTAKHLDEHKSDNLMQLLGEDVKQKRVSLVRKCEYLIHQGDESISPKARILLWRKGFYEPIALAKRLVRNQIPTLDEMKRLQEFILNAIERLKAILITVERRFDLDLKFLIDLSIFDGDEVECEKIEGLTVGLRSYALETIHALAISLGDLHRYYLDFGFGELLDIGGIGPERTAAFYFEAFKLNPKVGMPQNQLGTLLTGHNHNLDAVYHYFYALVCPVPFDLSEDNVTKILLENVNYLEHLDIENEENYQVTVADFLARFILIVDIFFYDKDVADFSGLCHAFLVDLKWLLEEMRKLLTSDMLFKIVTILLFCMVKLQRMNSDKVHHLNAFLLAICAQLISSCIGQVEAFVAQREEQNTKFREMYLERYEAYDQTVREARRVRQKMIDNVAKAPSASSYSDRNSLSVGGSSQMEKGNQQPTKEEAKKVKSNKMRRRRKRRQSSSLSDSDLTSNFDSDSDSSDISSVLSDSDDEEEEDEVKSQEEEDVKIPEKDFSMINLNGLTFNEVQNNVEDDEDIVVEEETIIYGGAENLPEVNVEIEKEEENPSEMPKKMKFKQKFHKLDPNITVEFAQTEITLQALKVLFDWLKNNRDIVISCHQTNPEFIHQTMTLLNHFNIDIFTSKVFFERQMLQMAGLRDDLRGLFDERLRIPIHEDMALKHFALFHSNQEHLDWEMSAKLAVTESEENLLRLFKMLDFGFYICRTYKFNYVFCTKGRIFMEKFLAKRRTKRLKGKNTDTPRRRQGRNRTENNRIRKVVSDASEEDVESSGGRKNLPTKRGYLRNRNGSSVSNVAENEEGDKKIENGDKSQKYALMGKLWLRSEVKSLESKIKRPNGLHLTPYLMMDSKSLTEYQTTVKNLVKARKFVVLIPNAVLSELDELKKHSDRARNVIRWLEQEFSKGNRFLRSQRDHETLPLPLIKMPKKIDREASVFLQIAQFCNYIVTNQMNPDTNADVVTLLTSENLVEKKCPHFSYYGILNSIPVKFDQIQGFYAKYRKK